MCVAGLLGVAHCGEPARCRPAQRRVEQRENRDRRNPEHDDFAERVEAAKIDEDNIDNIAAAARRLGLGKVIAGNRVEIPRHDRVGEAADPDPGEPRHAGVQPARSARRLIAHARQQVQREQQQDRRDDIDRDLGQRQIGRGNCMKASETISPTMLVRTSESSRSRCRTATAPDAATSVIQAITPGNPGGSVARVPAS